MKLTEGPKNFQLNIYLIYYGYFNLLHNDYLPVWNDFLKNSLGILSEHNI
jgi:hypothetical protein